MESLLRNSNFAKNLMDALPFGLLVLDGEGYVHASNDQFHRVIGVSEREIRGKLNGEVLGCLNAYENPGGCGSTNSCRDCDIRNLVLKALSSQKKQRSRANTQLVIDGQVRDLTLRIKAVPFSYMKELFIILLIENISKLCTISPLSTDMGFREIVGRDPKMLELFDTIKQIAQTHAPVLIQGETGTGKELVAIAIHKESHRASKHFVPVNCGALPEGLLETELFGHVKGAFTGAIRDKKGRFEIAHGGTIFLDEVGELSHAMQVKLLRVLQDGSFERLGSEKTLRVDARVVSATNKRLEEEVSAERFRQDLYYRLSVMPISLPPLRDRKGDISLLIDYFLGLHAEETLSKKISLSDEALYTLVEYRWPGNVRELHNVLHFALTMSQGQTIEPSHFPPAIGAGSKERFAVRHRKCKLKPQAVWQALENSKGVKSKAAQLLGVSRSTLYRFLAQIEKGKPIP